MAARVSRDPDEIKVLYLVYPILGETREEARDKHARMINEPWYAEAAVAGIGQITDILPLPHCLSSAPDSPFVVSFGSGLSSSYTEK